MTGHDSSIETLITDLPLHVPLFDLEMHGLDCLVPLSKMPTLVMDEFTGVGTLEFFQSTVVAKFYDPHKAVDTIFVLLYMPWGCFDVPKAVVK